MIDEYIDYFYRIRYLRFSHILWHFSFVVQLMQTYFFKWHMVYLFVC